LLKRYCESRLQWHVHLPDLNMPPHLALEKLAALIQELDQVVLRIYTVIVEKNKVPLDTETQG
jgi:hypothetical protein